MWPFGKKHVDASDLGLSVDKDGAVKFVLTDEERTEVDRAWMPFKGKYANPQYAEEMPRAVTSRGLSNYAQDCIVSGKIDQAFAAVTKAYSLYQLPIYLYDGACAAELMGETRVAKGLYLQFLAEQAQFQPTTFQQVILMDRDMLVAIKNAEQKLKRL
jgi:hypothetical protein